MQPFVTHRPARLSAKPRSAAAGLFILFWLLSASTLLAQMGFNSPAGVTPTQDVEFYSRNGFLVQQKYLYAIADPAASVNNMICGGASLTALAGILKDPPGDANYGAGASYSCIQAISVPFSSSSLSTLGIELVFEDLDTEPTTDYVEITDSDGNVQTYSGSVLPARIMVYNTPVSIKFVTNNNAIVGRGFRLRWRTLLRDVLTKPSPIAIGRVMQFDLSVPSFKVGLNNIASGLYSTALGRDNTVSGNYSTALGYSNTVSGFASTALGSRNTASEDYSTALGNNNTASGFYSTALGNYVTTGSFTGAFIVGDNSTGFTSTSSTAANQYTARFAGGYRLLTNSAATIGASLAAGGNAWATISDSTKKERFRPVDGPALLRSIGAMKLGTWNYIGQRDQRHYGPMAQEFFARFGHDALGVIGCDTLLNSHDFTAVTFTGVQALIHENEALKAQITQLRAEARRTESRLDAIETLLPARKRVIHAARK